jgi:hypothetical protein
MKILLDKKLHLGAGFAIGMVAAALAHGFHVPYPFALGVGAAAAAGIAKEWYDGQHPDKHTKDVMDAIFTAGGGVVGAIIGAFVL